MECYHFWVPTALHCTALHCTALHCTALHCTALHCTALHCTALHYTTLHCTILRYATLHCTLLRYSTLKCSSGQMQYTTMQYLFRKVGDTGMSLIRFQSNLPLWYIDSMYTKKNICERDKDIQTQNDNQKNFYVPVINSSKCCRSSSCSWKFPLESNIVPKNHSH